MSNEAQGQSVKKNARSRCPGHLRHWFAYYRAVGSSSPTCRRCGAPNPNYDPARDPDRRAARVTPPGGSDA